MSGPQQHARHGARVFAYVGAYTDRGKGIHQFAFDPESGALAPLATFAVPNPSWIEFDAAGRHLYATNAVADMAGGTGGVTAFAVDRATGALRLINTVSSGGTGPAHLSLDPSGRFVLVANYGGGSVAVVPIRADGSLDAASDVVPIVGPLGPRRAADAPPGSFADSGHDAPHAHMIASDPSGRFVLVNDLGTDRIFIYTLDRTAGRLRPHAPAFVQAAPGAGPRHVAFHPSRRFAYSLNEEASTIDLMAWDETRGTLAILQTLPTLPPGFEGTNFTSEVAVSPDGRFVYAGNRLPDTIAIFAIDPATGRMTHVRDVWTRGSYPRHFAWDPSRRFAYVLHTRSDNITVFRADDAAGDLAFTGRYVGVGKPSMIAFLSL